MFTMLAQLAYGHRLLDRVPARYLDDPDIHHRVCEVADRLVVVKVETLVSRRARLPRRRAESRIPTRMSP